MSACRYTLLENAFDFLLSASEYALSGNQRDYKYVILHLFAGIELLLKERLRLVNWALLFQEPIDEADQVKFQSGDFKGVNFNTLISRLKKWATTPIATADIGHIRSLRRHRNRAQHFDVDFDLATVNSQLVAGLSFALDFYDSKVRNLHQIDETVITSIHQNLSGQREFVAKRISQIQAELSSAEFVIECPRCFQEAMMLGDEPPHCAFCHYRPDAEVLAAEKIEDAEYLNFCPTCERETAILTGDGKWLCMSCGVEAEYYTCDKCGALIPTDAEVNICDRCYHQAIDDD